MSDELDILFKLQKHKLKYNVIFGLGTTGRLMIDLMHKIGVKVDCILTSDGHSNSMKYKELPIYGVSNLPLNKEECVILFTVKTNVDDIIDTLEQNNYRNITYINSQVDYLELLNIYYENYFNTNNIDISGQETININGLKIINPLLIGEEIWNAFLMEIGDLILPSIMNDYSRVDEGPYEYGDVNLNKNDVVIDCGAHIGLFSSLAAYRGCKVYAFEPFPKNIYYLSKSKALYSQLINICPYALSEKEGDIKIQTHNNESSEASIMIEDIEEGYGIEVQMITIDKFVEENNISKVDFIKADIEGAERCMLMGAKNTLARFAPKLSICTYHLEDDPQVLESIIREANPDYIIEHNWKKLYAHVPQK